MSDVNNTTPATEQPEDPRKDSLIEYPSLFPIKVMGAKVDSFVHAVTELARQFEQHEKVKVTIAQGGSEDLYQSAKKSRLGDIYFPGEPSYRDLHQAEGLLGNYKLVGYNQMALFVAKGNPKGVKPQLDEIFRKDLNLILGNANSGSVGQEICRTRIQLCTQNAHRLPLKNDCP